MNKPELICLHGDYLEREYANLILSRLPSYALFWASYIGNDGHSNYLPMPGVAEEVLKTRIQVWEHLYTLFESFALCWRLEERFAQLRKVESPTHYLDNINDWIAFYAHLGRIHDMAEKVALKFEGEGLFTPFDPYNEQRHTVLHYPKVPMEWVDNVLLAPWVGETEKHWKQGMRWRDLKPENFEFLSEIIGSTLRNLEGVTNAFLYRITELAQTQKGFHDIQWSEPVLDHLNSHTHAEKDSTISGFGASPPSGAFGGPSTT